MRVATGEPDVEILSLRSFWDQLRAWMSDETPLESRTVRGALLVAILLLVPVGPPRPEAVALLLALGLLLALSLRFRVGLLVLLLLLVAGFWMRSATYEAGGSDVLDATVAAINRAFAGGNPYRTPTPADHPYVYGPVALLWYLPFRPDPVQVEFAISIGLLVGLAVSGRAFGLVVYALMPTLYFTASDGSNDTSAGLLILVALLILRRNVVAGGFALAVAAGFKFYAAAWLPALIMWAGVAGVAGFALGTAVIWIPAILLWGFGPIVTSLVLAEGVHGGSFFSLAQAIEGVTHVKVSQSMFDRLRLFVGGAAALITAPLVRTWQHVVVAGIIVYAATLFTGYWATTAYLAGLAPLVCWHLDEWLGLSRLRWPDDPWGRITRWIDSRWPPRVSPAPLDTASA